MSDSSTQPPGSGEKVERVVPGPLSTSLADALDDPRSAAAAHAHTSNSTSCDPTQSTSSDPTQSTSEFAEGPVAASTLESHSPALASGSTLEKVLQDVRESNPDALDRVPFASEEVEAQCPDGAADSAAAVCDSVLPSPQHQPRYTQKRKYLQHLRSLVGGVKMGVTWVHEFRRLISMATGLPAVFSGEEQRELSIDEYSVSGCHEDECCRVLICGFHSRVSAQSVREVCERFGRVIRTDRLMHRVEGYRPPMIQMVFSNGTWSAIMSKMEPRDDSKLRLSSLGCVVVDFASPSEAARAIDALKARRDLTVMHGTLINFLRYADRGGYAEGMIQRMMEFYRWDMQTATMLHMLLVYGSIPIGQMVRERRPDLAASCHALSNAIAQRAKETQEVAPLLYLPLRGRPDLKLPYGLVDVEPDAAFLEVPDETGSCAVHCSGPRVLFDAIDYMTPEGHLLFNRHTSEWPLCDSDVVCVRSLPTPPNAPYLQTAVLFAGSIRERRYVLPPNTLLTLQKVEGPPFVARYRRWIMVTDWTGQTRLVERRLATFPDNRSCCNVYQGLELADGSQVFVKQGRSANGKRCTLEELGYDPNETLSIEVNRRLLTVTPRYMLPSELVEELDDDILTPNIADAVARAACTSKFGSSVTEIKWADTGAYIHGCENITLGLSHDLAVEWARDTEWADREGKMFKSVDCWAYVTGPAVPAELDTAVPRDINNSGRTPQDFLKLVNDFIDKRTQERQQRLVPSVDSAGLPGVSTPGTGIENRPLEHLTLDEVLAVRLYTGPGYQPINKWLRDIAVLPPAAQREAALNPSSSYGNTVRALTAALRKLASASNEEEASRSVYRGLRGSIQGSFWIPNEHGLVCATDQAFGSCSLRKETPIHFMDGDGQPNVLLELQQSAEDSAGILHCGANVSLLSQFAAEQEVMFPPMTMLRVVPRRVGEVQRELARQRRTSLDGADPVTNRGLVGCTAAVSNDCCNITPASPGGGGDATPLAGSPRFQKVAKNALKRMTRIKARLQVSEERTRRGVSYTHVVVDPTFTG